MEKQKTDQSIIYHIYFTIPSANEEKKQKNPVNVIFEKLTDEKKPKHEINLRKVY